MRRHYQGKILRYQLENENLKCILKITSRCPREQWVKEQSCGGCGLLLLVIQSGTALSKFGVFIVTNDIISPRAHIVTLIYIKIWTYDTWLIKYTPRLPGNLGCFVFNVNFLIVDYFYLRIRYLMKITLVILICDKMWMFKFS